MRDIYLKNFQQKKAEATRPTKRSLGEYDIGKGMGIRQNRGRGGGCVLHSKELRLTIGRILSWAYQQDQDRRQTYHRKVMDRHFHSDSEHYRMVENNLEDVGCFNLMQKISFRIKLSLRK